MGSRSSYFVASLFYNSISGVSKWFSFRLFHSHHP
jgi:hypothetical protein